VTSLIDYDSILPDEIEILSLVICGEEDKMTPVKYSKFLLQRIHNSQLLIIPNAGHFVFQEVPDEINDKIIQFLKRNVINAIKKID